MKRTAALAVLLAAAIGVAGALADTATQMPVPWQSPPFTSFVPNLATTDAAGEVYALATGPGPTFYIAAFNPQTNAPLASMGSGAGFVQITLPSGAQPETDFVQGSQLFVAGRVSAGAFIQGYNTADGTSPGPTMFNAPMGTSFTAAGGATAPASGGAMNVLIDGTDTVSHNAMLFAALVTNGMVGASTRCPSAFNTLTGGGNFAASSVAMNGAGQIVEAGVEISASLQLPAVAAVDGACSSLTPTTLAQPGGQSNDGFADNISAFGDNFIVGSDLSAASGAAIMINQVTATGAAVAGSPPFVGNSVASAAVTSVLPIGAGFALVGSERTSGSPSYGVEYRLAANGAPISSAKFTDSNGADVVPQDAQPVGSAITVLGLGSPTSGPNTLDVWSIPISSGSGTGGGGGGGGSGGGTTPQPTTPACLPVIEIQKLISTLETWTDKDGSVKSSARTTGRHESEEVGGAANVVITIDNVGDCDAKNIELSDVLPRGFDYVPKGSEVSIETSPEGGEVIERQPPRQLVGGALRVPIGFLQAHTKAFIYIRGHLSGLGLLRNVASLTGAGLSEVSNPAFLTVTPATVVRSASANATGASGAASAGGAPAQKAVDAAASKRSSLARVDVAVETSGKHGSCRWLTSAGRLRTTKRGCPSIVWLRATGTSQWRYGFKHRLPKGRYLLFVRPVARDGVAKSTFTRALHDLVPFTVR
ncbi:MAG TPA: hypothetical protein VFI54_14130 [Solirubrobacteraceae bacterium]|nr:hypothetical protein [Solirubrobacteraceae bacterium]